MGEQNDLARKDFFKAADSLALAEPLCITINDFVLDERFRKINRLLSLYSLGQFDQKLPLSSRLDEVDAFIAGVNMLGEELRAVTVSRNYFTNVFHSVSDMVLILNRNGIIEHVNKAVAKQTGTAEEDLLHCDIDVLLAEGQPSIRRYILRELRKEPDVHRESVFRKENHTFPVRLRATNLLNERGKKTGILLTAQDISLQQKTENLIIRAILDTQEKERKRLARDLHDSLGQQLSAVRFYISALTQTVHDRQARQILSKSGGALTDVINEMRGICFDLMPKTLEEFGLLEAVHEIADKITQRSGIPVSVAAIKQFPLLSPGLQTDIYRIIQEFTGNTLKHASASRIRIRFCFRQRRFTVVLADDGKGFDVASALTGTGMGLRNISSRVKSHGGSIAFSSHESKGTQFSLSFPIHSSL